MAGWLHVQPRYSVVFRQCAELLHAWRSMCPWSRKRSTPCLRQADAQLPGCSVRCAGFGRPGVRRSPVPASPLHAGWHQSRLGCCVRGRCLRCAVGIARCGAVLPASNTVRCGRPQCVGNRWGWGQSGCGTSWKAQWTANRCNSNGAACVASWRVAFSALQHCGIRDAWVRWPSRLNVF